MKNMFKCHVLLALQFVLALRLVNAQEGPLRLFLIGNSFSQNATRYLPQLSREGGHELLIGRAELGGCSMQRHWDSLAVHLTDTARGKPYNGKSLKQLLSEDKWDVVTIQQYSLLSGDPGTYDPYAQQLYDFVKQLQPEAKVVIHQTWAYRSDAKSFGKIAGEKRARDQQEMWEKSRAAYHQVARQLGVDIIPSGDAFYQVSTDPVWHFRKDTTFNMEDAVPPALPADSHSVHVGYTWSKEGKLQFDPNHANAAGCYLAGLVWYAFLFREDPAPLTFTPKEVATDFADYLKQVAWQVVGQ